MGLPQDPSTDNPDCARVPARQDHPVRVPAAGRRLLSPRHVPEGGREPRLAVPRVGDEAERTYQDRHMFSSSTFIIKAEAPQFVAVLRL